MEHIVLDAREFSSSTGRYMERLVHYLQEVDHEHRYSVLLKAEDFDKWEPTNPNFAKVACPHKEFTLQEQIGLLKQINELKPDLVHFGMVQQPVLYRGKSVTTMHDLTTVRFRNPTKNWLVFTAKQQVYKLVNLYVAHKADAIVTPSEFVKQDVAHYSHVNPEKITVTHEAVDDFSEPPAPIRDFVGRDFIMFNGRPLPHKNLRRLIKAFAQIYENHPSLYLMIAGKKDASHASYMQLAKDLGVGDRVVLTDWITDGQLKWAMQHTKAYIWPSLSEGFGLPPLEAMLHGAPVVSSNATCMPEVLGKAAHYFNPLSVDDMAQKIGQVISDQSLRNKLIESGRRQTRRYSWQRMAEQTLAIYKQVLGEE